MEKTLLASSSNFLSLSEKPGSICTRKSKSNGKVISCSRGVSGSYYSDYSASRLVDESMIVLRKRIRERKLMERSYEHPADWMQWEKQYYAHYDEIVSKLVGILQNQLMITMPSLALGMLFLVSMSVPTSTAIVFTYLANGVLYAVHLGC